jgi:hypothetical protein
MKSFSRLFCSLGLGALAITWLSFSSSEARATVDDALSFAYEGANPDSRRGFTFREDAWGGDMAVGEKKAVRAQLFAGNEYWFVTGTDDRGALVTVHIYNAEGKLVSKDSWSRGRSSGAFVAPRQTGAYWAIVTIERSPLERTAWALVYGFR